MRSRLALLYGFLVAFNVGAWAWAVAVFRSQPTLLGIALMVYCLGFRHAVDADHIAAIDNVTRKLIQENKRPVSVGFFFAIGHSAVVILIAALVACATTTLTRIQAFRETGSLISATVSATFLLAVAAMNIAIFLSIYRAYRRVRAGGICTDQDLDAILNNRGLVSRALRPLFRLVTRSWHMLALGFLFGLSFDTATEIAMIGVSSAQMEQGIPLITVLVFPALFAASMALCDTTDGVLMLSVYEWAAIKPVRKLYYNMTVTLVSVVAAVLIGGIEALNLIGSKFNLGGLFWDAIRGLNGNFNALGFLIVGLFAMAWLVSYAVCRMDRGELNALPAREEPAGLPNSR